MLKDFLLEETILIGVITNEQREEKAKEYGWFDVHTYHSVPIIKKGERISLTVFGKKVIKKLGLI